MKVADAWNTYYEYSQNASNLTRQFSFAAIAIVWLLKGDANSRMPTALSWPMALVTGSLLFDYLHYVIASIIWRIQAGRYEQTFSNDVDFRNPRWISIAIELMFGSKILLLIVAYGLIIVQVCTRIL